ncbi:MAG TPA: hypothetical protein VIM15_08465 [Gemmatimonadaceae bacterium]
MRFPCQRWVSLVVCGVALSLASGCGSQPSGPLDPALTGDWILPSVDTYSKFALQQRGTVVTGTLGYFSANHSGSTTFGVTGTADLPHVVLNWVEGGTPQSFDATLSEDQQTLSGTFEPAGFVYTFHRNATQ